MHWTSPNTVISSTRSLQRCVTIYTCPSINHVSFSIRQSSWVLNSSPSTNPAALRWPLSICIPGLPQDNAVDIPYLLTKENFTPLQGVIPSCL